MKKVAIGCGGFVFFGIIIFIVIMYVLVESMNTIQGLFDNIGNSKNEVEKVLNKESGLLGMSEVSGDNRDIWASINANEKKTKTCKISYTLTQNEERPFLKLTGKWLEKLGFTIGTKIKIYEGKDMLLLIKEK